MAKEKKASATSAQIASGMPKNINAHAKEARMKAKELRDKQGADAREKAHKEKSAKENADAQAARKSAKQQREEKDVDAETLAGICVPGQQNK